MMTTAPRQRLPLNMGAGGSAAPVSSVVQKRQAAMASLEANTNSDMYFQRFELDQLRPNPKNPRRKTIDAARVTDAVIDSLCIQPEESAEAWMARLDDYVEQVPKRSQAFWRGLVTLAGSIQANNLLQAIVADEDKVIIGGERRWLAARLAGLSRTRVNIRVVDQRTVELLSFIENEHRENLAPVEVLYAVRRLADIHMGGCGMGNPDITTAAFQAITGSSRSVSAQHAAFARLDEGDKIFEEFEATPPTSLKAVYSAVVARLRECEYERNKKALEQAGASTEAVKPPPAPKQTTLNVKLPPTKGMRTFLQKLGSSGILNNQVAGELGALVDNWAVLDDKKLRERLSTVFQQIADSLEEGPKQ